MDRGCAEDQQQRGCGGGSPRQTRGGFVWAEPPREEIETDKHFDPFCKRPLAARAPFTSPYYNGRVGVAVCLFVCVSVCVFFGRGLLSEFDGASDAGPSVQAGKICKKNIRQGSGEVGRLECGTARGAVGGQGNK